MEFFVGFLFRHRNRGTLRDTREIEVVSGTVQSVDGISVEVVSGTVQNVDGV